MLRWICTALLAGNFIGAAAACDLYPTTRPADVTGYFELATACLDLPPEPARFDAAAEAEFANRINAARAAEGLPPLSLRMNLQPAARFHSLDQIWNGTYGHEGAAGRSAGERISALDRTLIRSFSAENIAWARGDYAPDIVPSLLHNGLMESPGHRKNILAAEATHMAIGVVRVRDGWSVTQLFIRAEGEMATLLPLAREGSADLLGAELSDWELHGVETAPCSGVCGEVGGATVLVEGRKPMANGYGYRIIYLTGPSWDLAPPPYRAPTSPRLRGSTTSP